MCDVFPPVAFLQPRPQVQLSAAEERTIQLTAELRTAQDRLESTAAKLEDRQRELATLKVLEGATVHQCTVYNIPPVSSLIMHNGTSYFF